jgi:hypothetical protein
VLGFGFWVLGVGVRGWTCSLKMPQFLARRSLRSMPSLRGNAPSMITASAPVNASCLRFGGGAFSGGGEVRDVSNSWRCLRVQVEGLIFGQAAVGREPLVLCLISPLLD